MGLNGINTRPGHLWCHQRPGPGSCHTSPWCRAKASLMYSISPFEGPQHRANCSLLGVANGEQQVDSCSQRQGGNQIKGTGVTATVFDNGAKNRRTADNTEE